MPHFGQLIIRRYEGLCGELEESALTLIVPFFYSQMTPLKEKGAGVVIASKGHWIQETVDLEDWHFWTLSYLLCNMMGKKDGLSSFPVLIYCDTVAHFQSLGWSHH